MKYIVYFYDAGPGVGLGARTSKEPYVVYTIHDGEHYDFFERQGFQVEGSDTKVPRPHIIIRKDGTNDQVDLLTGHSVEEFTEQYAARKYAARMNGIFRVMES